MSVLFKKASQIRDALESRRDEASDRPERGDIGDVREWLGRVQRDGYAVRWLAPLELVIELATTAREAEARRWCVALLDFLILRDVKVGSDFGMSDFHEVEYALGFVVARLRTLLNEPALLSTFNPHPPEHIRQETLRQLHLYRTSLTTPQPELADQARAHLADCSGGLDTPFIRRLEARVTRFCAILESSRGTGDAALAAAALQYFVDVDDAVDDSSGPAGLIDDAYALEVTESELGIELGWLYSLLDPKGRTLNLGNLPLERTEFGTRFEVPEFMAATVGVIFEAIDGGERRLSITLPLAGTLPALLGWCVSLFISPRNLDAELLVTDLRPGQTVRVDKEYFANFDSVVLKSVAGEPPMRWLELSTWDAEDVRVRHSKRTDYVGRLDPVTHQARPSGMGRKGALPADSQYSESYELHPLERLLGLSAQPRFTRLARKVLVVTAVGAAEQILRTYTLFGVRLLETFPTGKIKNGGEIEMLSNIDGDPLLLITSRLEDARDFAMERPDEVWAVIVDTAASGIETLGAALDYMPDTPVVLVRGKYESGDDALDHHGFHHWEWADSDLRHMTWAPPAGGVDGIERYIRRIRPTDTPTTRIARLEEPDFLSVWQTIWRFRDALPEGVIEVEAVAAALFPGAFRLLNRLLSTTAPGDYPPLATDVKASLDLIRRGTGTNVLGSEQEGLLGEIDSAFRGLMEALAVGTGKSGFVQQRKHDHLFLCDDARVVDELIQVHGTRRAVLMQGKWWEHVKPSDRLVLLVGGRVRRNARKYLEAIEFPVGSGAELPLYDVEEMRLSLVLNAAGETIRRRLGRPPRLASAERRRNDSEISYELPRWSAALRATRLDRDRDRELDSDVAMVRQAVHAASAPRDSAAGVDATAVWFTDGSLAYFTDSTRVMKYDELKEAIDYTSVRELAAGHRVLFSHAADRDVVEERADNLLRPGERERAGLWIEVIVDWVSAEARTPADLHAALERQGVRRHIATIRNWLNGLNIGPDDPVVTLGAIRDATRDPRLAHVSTVAVAIEEVWKAHRNAGRELAREIRRGIEDAISAGVSADDAFVSDKVTVVTVAEIDTLQRSIDVARLNQRLEGIQ